MPDRKDLIRQHRETPRLAGVYRVHTLSTPDVDEVACNPHFEIVDE